MEKAFSLSKNNKYFWYYPESKSNIRFILNSNSKTTSINLIKKHFKNKNIDLIQIQIKYKKTISKLYPDNLYVIVNYFQLKNNRLYSLDKGPHKIFFKNSFIIKNKFKTSYLKNIIKKLYFKNKSSNLLDFKYYHNL